MSDPFQRYGIEHLSPSHMNMFIESQAKWWLCYIHKFKESSPAMWRGSAVEAGIVAALNTGDLDKSIDAAMMRFEQDALGEISPEITKARTIIPQMVEVGANALFDRGRPLVTQSRVEHWFPGIEVPVIGFTDAEWEEDGIEIKSTERMPSEIRASHARQTGFYASCKKKPFTVLYVTPTKFEFMPLEDPKQYLGNLEWTAHAIRNLLNTYPDADSLVRAVPPPDYDHIYLWKSEAARSAAERIWKC